MTQSVGNNHAVLSGVLERFSAEREQVAGADAVDALSEQVLKDAAVLRTLRVESAPKEFRQLTLAEVQAAFDGEVREKLEEMVQVNSAWQRVYLRFDEDLAQVNGAKGIEDLDQEVIKDAYLLHNHSTLIEAKKPSELSFEEVKAAFESTSRSDMETFVTFEVPFDLSDLEAKVVEAQRKGALKARIRLMQQNLEAAKGKVKTWGETAGRYYDTLNHITTSDREDLEKLIDSIDKERLQDLRKPQRLRGQLCEQFLEQAAEKLSASVESLGDEIAALEAKIDEMKRFELPEEPASESSTSETEKSLQSSASSTSSQSESHSSTLEKVESSSSGKVATPKRPLYKRKSVMLPVAGLVAVFALLTISGFVANQLKTQIAT